MRILCTNQALSLRGGTESYLQAVVPALRQLGHDVELFCMRGGDLADGLRADGFVVHEHDADLTATYDVVHAQHASTALAVRARLPAVPIVFASHSWFLDIEDPPREVIPSAVVVYNDIVEARVRASALGGDAAVHRLTQPVVIGTADGRRVRIRDHPRQALALSHNLSTRIAPLRDACQQVGIELTVLGRGDTRVDDPTAEIMRADLVFGSGRTILEALALGRAAFVYDETGCAGFVTADSYPRLEACGFTPDAGAPVEDLVAMLRQYDPALGTVGREFVVRHHAVSRHAVALVEIYRSAGAPAPGADPPAALRRLAIITQEAFEAEGRARSAEWDRARLERRLWEVEDRLGVVQAELDAVWQSQSWRLTAPLRRFRPRPDQHPGADEAVR